MPRDDLAARLLLALDLRDELALASLLDPDVAMVADTGDTGNTPATGGATGGELRGRARVIRSLLGLRMPHPDASLEVVHVNGGPGLAVRAAGGRVVGVLVIDADAGSDTTDRLWLTTAPAKLAHWNRRRPTVE